MASLPRTKTRRVAARSVRAAVDANSRVRLSHVVRETWDRRVCLHLLPHRSTETADAQSSNGCMGIGKRSRATRGHGNPSHMPFAMVRESGSSYSDDAQPKQRTAQTISSSVFLQTLWRTKRASTIRRANRMGLPALSSRSRQEMARAKYL